MKKVQEFVGYFIAVVFAFTLICIVVGIGLIGFDAAARCWSKLFGEFELSDFVLIASIVFTTVVKIVEFAEGRKRK